MSNKPQLNLDLDRVYFEDATISTLYEGQKPICQILELPWKNNERRVSCIIEGRYLVTPNPNPKTRFPGCFLINDVPGRSGILMHAGNEVSSTDGDEPDSLGCMLTGQSIYRASHGWRTQKSRAALQDLNQKLVFWHSTRAIWLTVRKAYMIR